MSAMTKEELKELMKEVAREAVEETLTRLGIQASDPIEAQKDFQHLREWRILSQSLKVKAMATLLGLAVTGSVAALWMGIKDTIHR